MIFRLVAKITKPKNRKRTAILIIFYFLSIEKQEFNEFAFKVWVMVKSVSLPLIMDDVSASVSIKPWLGWIDAMAWKIGVMKKDFKNEEVQKLVVFIRNHCERNGLPLIEWLKVQRRV